MIRACMVVACGLSPLAAETRAASGSGLMRVPVEVVSQEGREAKWVMVEVSGQSVPEPESLVLVLVSGLVLLRRRRQ